MKCDVRSGGFVVMVVVVVVEVVGVFLWWLMLWHAHLSLGGLVPDEGVFE